MPYNFDTIINRRATNSLKWNLPAADSGDPEVLPLWVADMDFQPPAPVLEAIEHRVKHGIFGYTAIPDACYDAFCTWMETRHHWAIPQDWIVVAPGVMPIVHWTVMAVTQPGDRVIVQPPVYPPFFRAARVNGCELVENPLICEQNRYIMNFDHLEHQMQEHRPKLLLLCSPHNPVGRVWTQPELLRVAELCLRYDVLLCSDEIHADLVFQGNTHIPTASLSKEIARHTITCLSPNKTFNLAGMSIAFAVVPDAQLRQKLINIRAEVGIHPFGNLFGALAAETAYRHGGPWFDQLLTYLQGNLDFLMAYINQKIPSIAMFRPEGTYLAWLDCRKFGFNDAELKEFMLKQAHVWLNDGSGFGVGGSGFQRLNFACPRPLLQQALERIVQATCAR